MTTKSNSFLKVYYTLKFVKSYIFCFPITLTTSGIQGLHKQQIAKHSHQGKSTCPYKARESPQNGFKSDVILYYGVSNNVQSHLM